MRRRSLVPQPDVVPHIVQLYQAGMHRGVFEVERYRLKNVGAKLLQCLRFGEDSMAKGACAIATFLGVANFKD
jgi:hypothetical protein